jgi:hypothetical protein
VCIAIGTVSFQILRANSNLAPDVRIRVGPLLIILIYLWKIFLGLIRFKLFLKGAFVGLAPIVFCAAFYFGLPTFIGDNPGALLSFAVLGLYLFSFLVAMIVSIAFIARKNFPTGSMGLILLVLQLMFFFAVMSGMINPF